SAGDRRPDRRRRRLPRRQDDLRPDRKPAVRAAAAAHPHGRRRPPRPKDRQGLLRPHRGRQVSDVLLSTLDDGVLTLTLHRPNAMNAFDQELNDAFIAALVDADADPEVRVVVVTGAGGRAFSAGADLKSVAAGKPTQ